MDRRSNRTVVVRSPRRCAARFALVAGAALALVRPLAARADDTYPFLVDARRFRLLTSFRVQLDARSPDLGQTSEFITYSAPQMLRVVIPAKKTIVVVIGRYAWGRGPAGRWKRVTLAHGADPLAAVEDTTDIANRLNGRTIAIVGTQTLDGLPMHVYDLSAPPRNGFAGETERIWIGVKDGYPHKIVEHRGETESTAVYSSFNQLLSVSGAQ